MYQTLSIVVPDTQVPNSMSILHCHVLEEGSKTSIPVLLTMIEEYVHAKEHKRKKFSARCADCGDTIVINVYEEGRLPEHYIKKAGK